MSAYDVILAVLVLLGHAALFVGLYNRIHSVGISHRIAVVLSVLTIGVGVGGGLVLLGALVRGWIPLISNGQLQLSGPADYYALLCLLLAAYVAIRWCLHRLWSRPPLLVRRDCRWDVTVDRNTVLPEKTSSVSIRHLLVQLPGNEILDLELADRAVVLPKMSHQLDGLTVVHLSDLHLTGYVGKAYFEQLVEAVNQQNPDLIAITGDILDNNACLAWIPDTLGTLKAKYGVYFVLGNHDLRVDTDALLARLQESGLVHVGGKLRTVQINNEIVLITGNERPWIKNAVSNVPQEIEGRKIGLAIGLSHSPDQLPWARRNGIDVLLAGHLHGGQIRLPLIGPVVSPSRKGPRYACGVFYRPPTLLHVSRGVSAKMPIRLNCSPEIAKLTLHSPGSENSAH